MIAHGDLVLYDAQADVAYWLYIQQYFSVRKALLLKKSQRHIIVHLPSANRLDPAAVKHLAELKQGIVSRRLGEIEPP